ncbi:sortase A [Weissella uvarum]|uniref:class A sortase n=1 Tax=Weissella uvarum TaxID=1479233 RepID=UPI00195F9F4A|nr:class A sortase [Weissella uvarum]MBM7617196.1 sortase A [Weissella uvarum]MCM0595489.1 sortase [Weissella uvarum]
MAEKTKQTKKKRRWWSTVLYVVLIIIALGLIFHNQIAAFSISQFQPKVTQKSVEKGQKDKKNANYDWTKVNTLDSQQLLKARANAGKVNFIGYVSVPAIGLSVPIANGVSDTVLSLGAGTLNENQKMGQGNYALASHFIQGESGKKLLFSPIYYHGKKGQKIYLTDMKRVYEYKTTSYRTVKPTDVQVADPVPGRKMITLITCDYTAERGRVIMQGDLTKQMKFKDAPASVLKSFEKDNRWIK